ncbi:hypothetical protein [Methyloglobulus sp.]|uniref:hypothetical protein n=1 Tax=Methyloglobulus sp. TaxID=2518622 RepID=UPI0032B753B6
MTENSNQPSPAIGCIASMVFCTIPTILGVPVLVACMVIGGLALRIDEYKVNFLCYKMF